VSTPEQRKAAADKLYDRAWGDEEPQYRPKKENWIGRVLGGECSTLSTAKTIDLQADLTTAIELLRELDALLEKQGYMPKGKSRGKIAAFLSATNGGRG